MVTRESRGFVAGRFRDRGFAIKLWRFRGINIHEKIGVRATR